LCFVNAMWCVDHLSSQKDGRRLKFSEDIVRLFHSLFFTFGF
jgi:hypothetical protein